MVVLVIIVATIMVDQASGWVRRRLIEGTDSSSSIEADMIGEPA